MKRLLLALSVCAFLPLVSSCLKDHGEPTIVLMGTESYVKPIDKVIPDTLVHFLKAMDSAFYIPQGISPANVQGEFELCPRSLKWSNVDAVPAGDSLFFRFGGDPDTLSYYPYGQHGMVTPCDYKETYFDLNHADTVYLMGEGNRITAYFVTTFAHINSTPGVDFDLTRGFMITGQLPQQSRDTNTMQVSCINMEVRVNANDPEVSGVSTELLKKMEGRIYVYEGPVYRKQWYNALVR